jgi:hypothetical protein
MGIFSLSLLRQDRAAAVSKAEPQVVLEEIKLVDRCYSSASEWRRTATTAIVADWPAYETRCASVAARRYGSRTARWDSGRPVHPAAKLAAPIRQSRPA